MTDKMLQQWGAWLVWCGAALCLMACGPGEDASSTFVDEVDATVESEDFEPAIAEPISAEELVEAVAKLYNMTHLAGECLSRNLPADSKLRANLVVAWRVSATSDEVVLQAYETILDDYPHELLHNPGKLLVINRLVFDVPETYPSNWNVEGADVSVRFWVNTPVNESEINYLFPFKIDENGQLCCLPTVHLRDFAGSGVALIHAADEYKFFSENFPKRDLGRYIRGEK